MYDSNGSKLLPISISYQADGNYLVKVGGNSSTVFEVKVTLLGDQDYRVEVDGVGSNVTLATYSKDQTKHIHIWHGSQHHHFTQQLGFELCEEEEMRHNVNSETSHPPGTVVAPMAGLVVKVLGNNGTKVEEGQPILVLEAMKMEHVVKAPSAGYVHGLEVAAGQQVSDGSILFRIEDK
ncbi:methylcrotonoyl-CoA carboxylase subunit alpha, mitochondrial-like [Carica papaya]|uniref:methylcrotonoyl-CoA carboxylase subunit alpha, mitochondrial-like n=1 Tax=Carica papaya TaxID=3649 RepID=UPI000B8D0F1B|nr:methylcrotonoyl-CoA carboxylase subunit alpha, mitochondrial-like [Carica papaya]